MHLVFYVFKMCLWYPARRHGIVLSKLTVLKYIISESWFTTELCLSGMRNQQGHCSVVVLRTEGHAVDIEASNETHLSKRDT